MDPDIALPAFLMIVAALLAGTFGYLIGRRSPRAADLQRIEALDAELNAVRSQAEDREAELEATVASAEQRAKATRTGVDEHFEASAELLAQLARDYRALFEHWAEGAGRLGGSANRAEAIIEQARARMLEDTRPADTDAAPPAEDGATEGVEGEGDGDEDPAPVADDEKPRTD